MSNKQDVRITAKTKPETIGIYRDWEAVVGGGKLASGADSKSHISSFFAARTIPKHLHSVQGLIRRKDAKGGKKGSVYSACTIDDVVNWSMTLRGGKQFGFDFMYEDAPIFEVDDMHAPCQSGYCE